MLMCGVGVAAPLRPSASLSFCDTVDVEKTTKRSWAEVTFKTNSYIVIS